MMAQQLIINLIWSLYISLIARDFNKCCNIADLHVDPISVETKGGIIDTETFLLLLTKNWLYQI